MYTYYTLVHYVRFHVALFDRIPDESIAKGNFNFLSPTHSAIFEPYSEVALDDVIRGWTAENYWDDVKAKAQGGREATDSSSSAEQQAPSR